MSRAIEVGGQSVGAASPVLVVAEIGNNHDGDPNQAAALVRAAAEAGADAVKLQTHLAEAEMLPSTPTPPHFDEPRYAFTERMQLDLAAHRELMRVAEECGVLLFSSPFSVEAVELLEELEPPAYKLASGEVSNPLLVEALAATGRPLFVSTGMSDLGDLEPAVGVIEESGIPFVLMQCTSVYPCPPEKLHLRAMVRLQERFACHVGLSDHSLGTHAAAAAVALGAVCIEKHFTLSRRLYGPDHQASLEPDQFAALVDGVREAEASLGEPEKVADPELGPVRLTFEKSVVSASDIPEGALIEPSMLTAKRPASGVAARRLDEVLGRRATRAIRRNEILMDADFA